jgi:hypothetical protein
MARSPTDRATWPVRALADHGRCHADHVDRPVHLSSDGLDHAGVPDGVDFVWQLKHFLGAPYPGGTEASVNLAHVVAAVEFVDAALVEQPSDESITTQDEVVADLGRVAAEPLIIVPMTESEA